MENNEILEVWAGIISWKSWVESFSVANSKSSFLLQTADVLATSVMKTLEKIFSDRDLNEYDGFVKILNVYMSGKRSRTTKRRRELSALKGRMR